MRLHEITERPAFPNSHGMFLKSGMTMHQYFAAQAMTGLLANPNLRVIDGTTIGHAMGAADIMCAFYEQRAKEKEATNENANL